MPNLAPEDLYRTTTDTAERRTIRAAVIERHRRHVFSVVRRSVDREHWREASQAGAIGLLIALEKYDPSRVGPDRGAAFWFFAGAYVRNEIQKWIDRGVYWRPRNRNVRNPFLTAVEPLHRNPVSLDAATKTEGTLHDVIADTRPSVETIVTDAQLRGRLWEFAKTLSPRDRRTLFSGSGHALKSPRYQELVAAAAEFVQSKAAETATTAKAEDE